jgi:hypothetical protein
VVTSVHAEVEADGWGGGYGWRLGHRQHGRRGGGRRRLGLLLEFGGGAAESIYCAYASTPGVETDEGEDATNADVAATASTMVVAFSSMEEDDSQSLNARATVGCHSDVQGSPPLRSSRNNANSS